MGDTVEFTTNGLRLSNYLAIAATIVARQFEHFACGAEVVPIILADVAGDLGLDASTIFRGTEMLISSHDGAHPAKYYFTASRVHTEDGPDVTGAHATRLIQEFIGAEDALAPLSDDDIMNLLAKRIVACLARSR